MNLGNCKFSPLSTVKLCLILSRWKETNAESLRHDSIPNLTNSVVPDYSLSTVIEPEFSYIQAGASWGVGRDLNRR